MDYMGMSIGQISTMMLSELQPHIDEVLAYQFEQIDATSATPEEAQAKKKTFLQKYGKLIVGGGLGLAAAHGIQRHGAGLNSESEPATNITSRVANYGRNIASGAQDIGKTIIAPKTWGAKAATGIGKGIGRAQVAIHKVVPSYNPM
jgi:hypothetical protein